MISQKRDSPTCHSISWTKIASSGTKMKNISKFWICIKARGRRLLTIGKQARHDEFTQYYLY